VQHQRQRELPRGDALLLASSLDALGEFEVVLRFCPVKRRAIAAEVALVDLIRRGEAPGEKAPPERE